MRPFIGGLCIALLSPLPVTAQTADSPAATQETVTLKLACAASFDFAISVGDMRGLDGPVLQPFIQGRDQYFDSLVAEIMQTEGAPLYEAHDTAFHRVNALRADLMEDFQTDNNFFRVMADLKARGGFAEYCEQSPTNLTTTTDIASPSEIMVQERLECAALTEFYVIIADKLGAPETVAATALSYAMIYEDAVSHALAVHKGVSDITVFSESRAMVDERTNRIMDDYARDEDLGRIDMRWNLMGRLAECQKAADAIMLELEEANHAELEATRAREEALSKEIEALRERLGK